MLNFCDFIQVYVFTTNHHLNHAHFLVDHISVGKNGYLGKSGSMRQDNSLYSPLSYRQFFRGGGGGGGGGGTPCNSCLPYKLGSSHKGANPFL